MNTFLKQFESSIYRTKIRLKLWAILSLFWPLNAKEKRNGVIAYSVIIMFSLCLLTSRTLQICSSWNAEEPL